MGRLSRPKAEAALMEDISLHPSCLVYRRAMEDVTHRQEPGRQYEFAHLMNRGQNVFFKNLKYFHIGGIITACKNDDHI